MGLADYGDIEVHHKCLQNNLDLYDKVVAALSDGNVTEDDIWIAADIKKITHICTVMKYAQCQMIF